MSKVTRPVEQPAGATAGLAAVANSDMRGGRGSTSSFETVAGDVHMGSTSHAAAGRSARASERTVDGQKQKLCCHCGKDVAHEERFKDKSGYYWCMDCGVQENREKHALGHAAAAAGGAAVAATAGAQTIACPDCSQAFAPGQLVEYERVKVCNGCADKRQKHAAREAARAAARQAAVAEAAIEEARHRRHMLIGVAVAAALAVAWAIYVAF